MAIVVKNLGYQSRELIGIVKDGKGGMRTRRRGKREPSKGWVKMETGWRQRSMLQTGGGGAEKKLRSRRWKGKENTHRRGPESSQEKEKRD